MRSKIIPFAILLLAAYPAFAQDSPPAGDTAAPPPAADATAPPADAAPPAPSNPVMTGPRLLIATSMGDITLQLDSVRAPKSVANVLRYVKEKHYDGTVVYRVAKGFVLEMGSWDAKVKGRPGHPGAVPLEANNGLSNLRGTVSLARGDDPTSAQADFFLNLADNSGLDHNKTDSGNTSGFAVFGQVVSGMDVADAISVVPVGDHGPMKGEAPVDPITIKKISLLPN